MGSLSHIIQMGPVSSPRLSCSGHPAQCLFLSCWLTLQADWDRLAHLVWLEGYFSGPWRPIPKLCLTEQFGV